MGPETADAKDAVDEGLRYLADHLVVMVVWLEEQLDKDLDIEIASADRACVRQLLPNLLWNRCQGSLERERGKKLYLAWKVSSLRVSTWLGFSLFSYCPMREKPSY